MKLCEKGRRTEHQPSLVAFKDASFDTFKKDDEVEAGISN